MNLYQFYTHLTQKKELIKPIVKEEVHTKPMAKKEYKEYPKKAYAKSESQTKKEAEKLSTTKIATTLFIKSINEIKVVSDSKQYEVQINGIEQFNFENEKRQQFWERKLKNFLFETLMKGERKPKIFIEVSGNGADIFFDYEKKDSLISRIKKVHDNFLEGAAPQRNPSPYTPKM